MLPWSNLTAFQAAKEEVWTVNGLSAGTVRSVPKLSFVKVADAGHMSPMDKPENTLDMITRFVQGKSFDSHQQVVEPVHESFTAMSERRPWVPRSSVA